MAHMGTIEGVSVNQVSENFGPSGGSSVILPRMRVQTSGNGIKGDDFPNLGHYSLKLSNDHDPKKSIDLDARNRIHLQEAFHIESSFCSKLAS